MEKLQLNFKPFPYLNSSRLLFRPLSESDVDEVFELRSDPVIMQYIPRPLAKTKDDALEHIRSVQSIIDSNQGINWSITLKEDNKLIGIIGFYRIQPENYRCELGYILLPEHQNKGYISEAIKTVLHYVFDVLNFHSVEAIIDPGNLPSEKVLLKNGFVKEAHILENEYWDGKFLDTVIYSLLKRNFVASN